MQCPECRSETPGSLGRCTRCDAVLPQVDEASPWSAPPGGNEPWPPEPWQPEPVQQGWRAEPPQDDRPWAAQDEERPWAEQSQERPWAEQPQERPWGEQPVQRPWTGGPAPERPWGEQPGERQWNEQPPQQRPWDAEPGQQQWSGGQAQQPWNAVPEEQRRSSRNDGEQWLPDEAPRWRGPLIAGLVAALLTAVLVVGYVFWSKDDGSDDSLSQPGTSQDSGDNSKQNNPEQDSPDSDEPDSSGNAQTEAAAVDTVLGDMSTSRKKLANITYTCANKSKDISAFRTAVQERQGQLSDVKALSFGALENGDEVKKALVAALDASIESNQEALTWLEDEDGCDKDAAARLKDVTDKATETKRTFLDLWNPIATAQGLPTWTRENI